MVDRDPWGDASFDSWGVAESPKVLATPWQQWRCAGKFKGQDGQMRDCNAWLGDFSFGPGSRARIKCLRCNTINVRETLAAATEEQR